MEQIKCPSCGLVNPPGEVVCRDCGTSLVAPYATPGAVPPAETVVVRRPGGSSNGVIAAILGLIAILVVGFIMYQWGRSNQTDEDLARERNSRDRTTSDRTATSSTPLPPVTTTPPPVVTTTPSAPVTVTVPPPTTGASSSPATSSADAACARYVAQIDPLLRDWEDALATAETATGPDLKAALDKMRDVERKVARVSAPACAGKAQGHLVTAMTSMIDAFGAAPADDPTQVTTGTAYQQARELYDRFQTEYGTLKATSY